MSTVLLNSGGKDTLATAMVLREQGHELHSLFIDLGTSNSEAAGAMAARIAAKFCASHGTMSVRGIQRVWHERPGQFSVPHQSVFVHILGAVYAYPLGHDTIASGERHGARDRGQDFCERVQAVLAAGILCKRTPTVVAPVFSWLEEQIYQKVKNEPLWRETITCNEHPPCGVCPRCRTRANWLRR